MKPDHSSPLSIAYFEQLAQEPGKKALCLPPHYGTLDSLLAFIWKHWQRGFVIATKTSEQAKHIAANLRISFHQLLHFASPNSAPDAILLLDPSEPSPYEDYLAQPLRLLERYPIIVTTHETLVQDPPYFYMSMQDHTTSASAKKPREFVIIFERPDFHRVTLDAAEYAFFCLATEGSDTAAQAIHSVMKKLGADNPLLREPVTDFLAGLGQSFPDRQALTPCDRGRALLRLGRITEARTTHDLEEHKDGYTIYEHCGLLTNAHVWVVEGTADLTLENSSRWTVIREPAYDYRLIGSQKPTILDIAMIPRNLEKLPGEEGDRPQKPQRVKTWIADVEQQLHALARKHTQIVVVMWKDLKGNPSATIQDEIPLVESNFLAGVENGLINYFRKRMAKHYPEKFVFTSYHPRHTAALVAQCREADAILFLGKFFLPPPAIAELNHVHKAEITTHGYSIAELVQQTFRTRCQFGKPVAVYFTPDWGKDFIQEFLRYTHATDQQGQPLSVFTEDELQERLLIQKELTKPQRRMVSQLLAAHPALKETWNISLPQKEVQQLLKKKNSRDLQEALDTLTKKGVYIHLT